ncbi:MAG: ArsR family transcriptional regulator [Candidatus Hadarchaeales archaeon]
MSLGCRFPPDYNLSKREILKIKKRLRETPSEPLKLLGVLSHPIRLKILRALEVRELCVCVSVSLAKYDYPRLSYHLRLLKRAGLIKAKKVRNFIIFSLTPYGRRVMKMIVGKR